MDRENIKKVWAAYQEVQEKANPQFVIPEEVPVGERNAFMGAAAAAHKAGKSHFNFAGKKHAVTMKKDTANAILDDVKESNHEDDGEKVECPKCEGKGCDHCEDKGYHMKEEVEVTEANQNPKKDESEKMADNFTASDKKFADAHGGIDPKTPEVDGMKAAADTAAAIKASEPGENHKNRSADKSQGDKSIVKSSTNVKEAKTIEELMQALMDN